MRGTYPKDSITDLHAPGCSVAKLYPVVKPAASDYVIYRGQCPVGMIQVTMQHAKGLYHFGLLEWIKTIPGKGWFVYFRIYGPEAPAFNGSWKPGDFEVVK